MRQSRLFLALVAAVVCTVAVRAYNPPVGIPNPAEYFEGFDPIDSPKPDPRTRAPGWFATAPRANAQAYGDTYDCYYIDNTHPSATDSGNPYGHPGKPRATIPNLSFSPGAYVEIHGDGGTGQYRYTTPFRPAGVGTSDNPIWFVGVDQPILSTTCDIGSSNQPNIAYLVFDGLHWKFGGRLDLRPRFDDNHFRNITFRNCVFRGTEQAADATGVSVGSSGNTPTRTVKNVVFHNCEVSHYGDKNSPGEECGVYPTFHVTNMWFLDGKVHNNAEDGFGGSHGGQRTSTGYYIGRNQIYDNLTDPMDIKAMGVVVASENRIWGHQDVWVSGEHKSSGSGAGATFHYAGSSTGPNFWKNFPEDSSFLFNTVIGGRSGIGTSGTGRLRIIGNIFQQTRHKPSNYSDTPYAIDLRGIKDDTWIAHNTIYDCEGGIRIWDSPQAYNASAIYYRAYVTSYNGKSWVCINDNNGAGIKGTPPTNSSHWREFRIHIIGNIIANRPTEQFVDIRIDSASLGDNSITLDHNLVFHPAWGGAYVYGSSEIRNLAWMKANTPHQVYGLSADPMFINAPMSDFRLRTDSPAINAMTSAANLSAYDDYRDRFGLNILVDSGGFTRGLSGAMDLGALEYRDGGVTIPDAPSSLSVQPDTP